MSGKRRQEEEVEEDEEEEEEEAEEEEKKEEAALSNLPLEQSSSSIRLLPNQYQTNTESNFNQTRWSERTADHVTLWRLFSSLLRLDSLLDSPLDSLLDNPLECPMVNYYNNFSSSWEISSNSKQEKKKTVAKALHGQRFSLTT